MRQFAGFAEQAKGAIAGGDHAALADLMDANFALRRKVYGDPCVGEANLSMVRIAHKHGSVRDRPFGAGPCPPPPWPAFVGARGDPCLR